MFCLPPQQPVITIAAKGAAAVPAARWAKAKGIVTNILQRAAVQVSWHQVCDQRTVCIDLTSVRPPGLDVDMAGYAVLRPGGGGYAAVYLPGITRTAYQLESDFGLILGITIAHEIGHLFLGPGHSPGVMSPRFDSRQVRAASRGELLFTSAQAQSIRLGASP